MASSTYDGSAFLDDYKKRHSTYFRDPQEERPQGAGRVLAGLADMATADLFDFDRRGSMVDGANRFADSLDNTLYDQPTSRPENEGMDTSSTRDLNSVVPPGSTASDTGAPGTGERPTGGMTREEFESLSDEEKFERVGKPAMRQALGKPQGLSRIVAGVADFLTGDQYDFDQRGQKQDRWLGPVVGGAYGSMRSR